MTTIANIPSPDRPGGSKVGSTFIKNCRQCPFKVWLAFLAPHPLANPHGIGLENSTLSKPLSIGQYTHIFLAAYHLCPGSRKASLDYGLEQLDNAFKAHTGPTILDLPEVEQTCQLLAQQYHDHWDNNCYDVMIVPHRDTGHPMIEQNLEVSLGYKDYIFTARLDAIASYHGNNYSFEHKTADTSKVGELTKGMEMDIQATGQLFLMHHLLPELDTAGMLLNILIKRAGKDKPKCTREFIYRSDLALEKFRLDTVKTLARFDEFTELYDSLVASGMEEYESARQAYPQHGDRGCAWCEFRVICTNPEQARAFAEPFLARSSNPRISVND